MVMAAFLSSDARIRGRELGFKELGLGDWVVAARCEWMGAGDRAQGKPASTKPAVTDDGDVRVLAAGGEVLALGDRKDVQQGRQAALVEREQSGGGALAARMVGSFAHEGVETAGIGGTAGSLRSGMLRVWTPRS